MSRLNGKQRNTQSSSCIKDERGVFTRIYSRHATLKTLFHDPLAEPVRKGSEQTRLAAQQPIHNIARNSLRKRQRSGFNEYDHNGVSNAIDDKLGSHAISRLAKIKNLLGESFKYGAYPLRLILLSSDEKHSFALGE
jgi:hypothetical protein